MNHLHPAPKGYRGLKLRRNNRKEEPAKCENCGHNRYGRCDCRISLNRHPKRFLARVLTVIATA